VNAVPQSTIAAQPAPSPKVAAARAASEKGLKAGTVYVNQSVCTTY
jgi:hypothetical protein